MKQEIQYPAPARVLFLAGTVLATGFFGAGDATASQWTNADEDHLWNNPANWTAGVPDGVLTWINGTTDEARIDVPVPGVSEIIVGQGANDGIVRMQTGGSLSSSHVNLAFGGNFNGTWFQDDGTLNAGQLRLGREGGGIAEFNLSGGLVTTSGVRLNATSGSAGTDQATGILNVTGGTLDSAGPVLLNANAAGATTHQTVNLSGGTITTGGEFDLRIGRGDMAGGTATVNVSETGELNVAAIELARRGSGGTGGGALNVAGGTVDASGNLEIGHQGPDASVAVSGGSVNIGGQTRIGNLDTTSTATGALSVTGGSVTLGGLVGVGTVGENMGRGHVTIGGNASLNTEGPFVFRAGDNTFTVNGSNATINADRPSQVGLEFNDGNTVAFHFDAFGPSTVHVTSEFWIAGNDVTLDINATEVGVGMYTLFAFGSNRDNGEFGTVNATLPNPAWEWDVHYGVDNIQFEVIPEPSTYALLLGVGALGIVCVLRRRRTQRR